MSDQTTPLMPSHSHAEQYARDTMSGSATADDFSWGERNLAACYLVLCQQLADAQKLLSMTSDVLDKKQREYSQAQDALKKNIEASCRIEETITRLWDSRVTLSVVGDDIKPKALVEDFWLKELAKHAGHEV